MPSPLLSVFHTVSGLHPRSGGPSRTVPQLADALARLAEFDFSLITQGLAGEPVIQSNEVSVTRYLAESRFRFWLATGLPFGSVLRQAVLYRRPSLIHNHGIWTASNHRACSLARKFNIPYIIQPMGMLEPWAMKYRATKKRLAMRAYQRKDLDCASLFIATSGSEMNNLRQLGLIQPVAIIPNGILLNHLQLHVAPKKILKSGKRILLYLSRVHPVKGLLNLIEAWSKLANSGWELQIAGPDEGGHLAEVMDLARRLGVENSVRYIGILDGDEKVGVYQSADLFVLPTFSENFGIVVIEALSYGVPVITTRRAPWADLTKFGCGWWIDIGVDPLTSALQEAMSMSDAERLVMGMRGREYVRRYDWDSIAKQTIAVYRWVLGQGSKPDCVYLN